MGFLRTKIAVWTLAALFLLALAMTAASLAWSGRHNALQDGQAQVERFMAVSEAALNRNFLAIDILLASTEELLLLSGSAAGAMEPWQTSRWLRSAARQNLLVRFIALLDAQGRVLASSDAAAEQVPLRLPDGFFAKAMAQELPATLVSSPVVGQASAEQVLYFARPVPLADGTQLLALAEVPAAMLTSVLLQGGSIAGLEVTLEDREGRLILSTPEPPSGRDYTSPVPLHRLSASSVDWDMVARLSATPALVQVRPTLHPALWISASLPRAAALSGWQMHQHIILAVALAFGLTVLAVAGFALDYLGRMANARQTIAQSKAMLDQALESMVSGFMLLDAGHRVRQWNHRFEEFFPWLVPMLAHGVSFRDVLEATVPHQLPQASAAERQRWVELRLLEQLNPQGTFELLLPSGRSVQIVERTTPEGGLVITYHDVSDLRRASAEIEHLAFYDPLTGLPNRRLLLDRLAQATVAAERTGQYGALLFLDLDDFKGLNDTQGHEMGDRFLQQVAQRLRACVRQADTVARLGGDEFVILLTDLASSPDEAAALARRVGENALHSLAQPYLLGTHTYHGSCSMGATLWAGTDQSAAELLKRADIAMYQVKAAHGNGLCFFDPRMQTAISQRVQLETDLQTALVLQQFKLHYQPQYTLAGTIVGAEALLRWQHPERGLVTPGEFIAVAEESDLIVAMGDWVLRSACEQLVAWGREANLCHLRLSINVSARQFRRPDFAQQVIAMLQQTGAPAHLLKLELTESLMLDNVDDTIAKMHQLRTKGVRFSVDDFGTGYSSLAYLTRLPLHQIKIDQSFVRNLGVRPTDDVIVQTIIGMARNLELEVIAEGVETEAQKKFLALHGCDLYQGYLLGRPMPVADLEVQPPLWPSPASGGGVAVL